ncbi:MAG: helix-turn-helix domain-containing protein [Actinomycetia bacterium]|nr:helix-turn-helix domain-containing protein [Actinomycetes bacterium]
MSLTTVHDWRAATDAGEGGAVGPTSPTVARRVLAQTLRDRRHELNVDVKTITDRLGFSRNYWSAIENDRSLLAVDKLEILFDLLEFDETERDELRDLRQEARKRGWWMEYPVLESEELKEVRRIYGLEAGAHHLQTFEGAIVTGLLQTEEYARAIISSDPVVSMVHVEQFVEIRMRRQKRLQSNTPLRLTSVMSEAALHQEIGGPATLRNQLHHLVTMITDLPNSIDLRVMPFSVTPGGIVGASTLCILDFQSQQLQPMLWQESITAVGFIDESHKILQVRLSYEQALERSLSREASLDLVERRVQGLIQR